MSPRKKVIQYRYGPVDTFPALRLAFIELVAKYNDLVRDYNAFAAEPVSFLALTDLPNTLAGFGIIDAAPLVHKHTVADIIGLPPGSAVVHWADISDHPTTLAGYGITDAAHFVHSHHWADIVDPPPFGGVGPQGLPGIGIPGMDAAPPQEPLMIRGLPGERGPRGLSIPGLDGRDAPEPIIIPGTKGLKGDPGAPGAPGVGAGPPPTHEGVLAFGEQIVAEPLMLPGSRGAAGARGLMGMPGLDAPPPQEPMIIRGPAGAAAAGGAAADPPQGSFAPGSFVVPTGKFAIMSGRLALTGAQRATLAGTSRLRIT